MAEILVTKPGAISAEDKAALREAGIVAIEADNPDTMTFMRARAAVPADMMAVLALEALASSSNLAREHSSFVRSLAEQARECIKAQAQGVGRG